MGTIEPIVEIEMSEQRVKKNFLLSINDTLSCRIKA